MFVNSAGSLEILKQGVDYSPTWFSTDPKVQGNNSDSGNGPGYWNPPVGAIQVLADPGEIVMWTLKGNTKYRAPLLRTPVQILDGTLPFNTAYYYRIVVVDADGNVSFPSKATVTTLNGINGTIKLGWNRVFGASGYVLFRATKYGEWNEKIDVNARDLEFIDDGTQTWVANNIVDYGVPVTVPAGAFVIGNVYNIWLRKYTGSVDNAFLGHRPPNYPPEL